MTLQPPKNANYSAQVVRIDELIELPNCDNVQATPLLGCQAIVSKAVTVGAVGVVFTAETQLSHEFASANNLYRHSFDWEGAVVALWQKAERQTAILIDLTTQEASASLAPVSATVLPVLSGKLRPEPLSGSATTPTRRESGKSPIAVSTPRTSENADGVLHPSNELSVSLQGDATPLRNTGSPSNGTTVVTLKFADAAKFVQSGEKFLSWITATLRERFGDSYVGGVTLPSLGLEILSKVSAVLGDTSSETQFFLDRHKRNQDPTQAGYLEDNRRVKAMKFRGHRSDALFLPLESLAFALHFDEVVRLKDSDYGFKVGDVFDELNGTEICRKYIPANVKLDINGNPATGTEKKSRVSSQNFPQHFDTDNWFRNEWKIPDDAIVTVTQKLHGTSVRIGRVLVDRELTRFERVKRWFGFKVQDQAYEYVFGSRTRTKDVNLPDGGGYYDDDLWVLAGKQVENGPGLPEGMILYGELIGWTPSGKAIQPGYTYGVPKGEFRLVVYRITHHGQDLSWVEVLLTCNMLGLNAVPDLWLGRKADLPVQDFLDVNYQRDRHDQAWPLSNAKGVDEGVCIRWDQDGKTPVVLKCKSPIFLQGETRSNDKGVVDIETLESLSGADMSATGAS